MKIKVINEVGNWESPWDEGLKNEIRKYAQNTIVGEQLILETDEFKVWSIHLPAGKSLLFHRHSKPYFFTIKNSGKSRSFYADGSITETEYEKDDIKFYDDLNEENFFIHNLENIGDTELVFTTVEFK